MATTHAFITELNTTLAAVRREDSMIVFREQLAFPYEHGLSVRTTAFPERIARTLDRLVPEGQTVTPALVHWFYTTLERYIQTPVSQRPLLQAEEYDQLLDVDDQYTHIQQKEDGRVTLQGAEISARSALTLKAFREESRYGIDALLADYEAHQRKE